MKDLRKKIRNTLSHYLKKRRNQKIIRYYDGIHKIIDDPSRKSLYKLGHLTLNFQQLFDESINEKSITEIKQNIAYDRHGNYIKRDIPLGFLKTVLKSQSLIQLTKEYIGENCRLDDIYLWSKSPKYQGGFDISEGWHTDDVGKRLKIFISLDCEENAPTTLYIEGSNLRPYKARLFSNLLRYFGYISNKKNYVIEHTYKNYEVFIFDTNGEHRGHYDSKTGERFFLVIEFINKHKANIISKDCPCGPGQSNKGIIYFPMEMKKELCNNPLIDKDILKYEKNRSLYSYSILNLYN